MSQYPGNNLIVVNANIARRTKDNAFTGTNSFGDSSNYSQFSTNGTLTLHGTATAFDDIVFEMTPGRLGALTKPDWDATNNGFLFPQNDTSEYVDIIVQMPHRWSTGTVIYPHVHVRQAANQQAVFKIDYKWFNIGEAIPAGTSTLTMGTYVETYSSGSIHQILKSTGGISGSGKGISSLLICKLYRDDNAYTGDILTYQFDIHIEIDSLGSSSEYSK